MMRGPTSTAAGRPTEAVTHRSAKAGGAATSGGFLGSRLLLRHQVLHQALEPHHQRRVALDLDLFVLDALHKGQLLVLGSHGGKTVGRILEAQSEGRRAGNATLADDALVFDDEMASHLAVQGVQLEHQVFAGQLLLKFRISAAGFGHQAAQHPQEKAKLHARGLEGGNETAAHCSGLRGELQPAFGWAVRGRKAPNGETQLTESFSDLPGLKATVLLALMVTGAPVCGFFPVRAPRWRCTKVPKPTRVTLSLRFRAPVISSSTALSTRLACSLVRSAFSAMAAASSGLRINASLSTVYCCCVRAALPEQRSGAAEALGGTAADPVRMACWPRPRQSCRTIGQGKNMTYTTK